MFAIRVSSVFLIGALLVRVTLFVADDSRLLDLKSLVAIERRISRLIDEALRHRSEERERHEAAERIGSAVRHAVRRAVIRVAASSTIGRAVGAWTRGALTLPIRAGAAIRAFVKADEPQSVSGDRCLLAWRSPLLNRLTRSAA
jgi:hypothetical protein